MGHLVAFRRADNISKAFPLRSSRWRYGASRAFRRADKSQTCFLFEVPHGAVGHLGAFRRADKLSNVFPLRSFYGAMLFAGQTTSQTPFLFEVPYGAMGHLGAFRRTDNISNALPLRSSLWRYEASRGFSRSCQHLKPPSSSKFPMALWGI